MIESQFEKMLDNMNVDDIVVLKGMFNFQGNVVSVDKENGFFEFYVTHADDEDVIGDTIPVNNEVMGAVFQSLEVKKFKRTKEDILAVIDFILSAKPLDVEWLEEKRKELIEFEKREKFLKSRRLVG